MAEPVYNQNTNDLVTSYSQSKPTELKATFEEVGNVSELDIAQQTQIAPRQTRTGVTRGTQVVQGTYQVKDNKGRIVVLMGYSPGAF